MTLEAHPPRYHSFDRLYQVLLTELSVEFEAAGEGDDLGDDLKSGLQGFLREAVVSRCVCADGACYHQSLPMLMLLLPPPTPLLMLVR